MSNDLKRISCVLLNKITIVVIVFLVLTTGLTFFIQPAKAASVTILSHRGYLVGGAYYVYGEFQNFDTTPVKCDKVTATFYDSSNALITVQDWLSGFLKVILPNQKSPFYVLLNNSTQASKVDHYTLEVTTLYTSAFPLDLRILSNSSSIDIMGYMHITGELENAGTTTVTFPRVFVTCYDSGGKVVYSGNYIGGSAGIPPGQKSNFEILISSTYVALIQSYVLTEDSYVATTSTPTPAQTPTLAPSNSPTSTPASSPSASSPPTSTFTASPLPTSSATTSPYTSVPPQTSTPTLGPSVSPTSTLTPTATPNPFVSPTATSTTAPPSPPTVEQLTTVAWAPPPQNAAAATVVTAVALSIVSIVAAAAATISVGASTGNAVEKTRELLPESVKKWLADFASSKRKPNLDQKTSSPFLPTKAEALAYGVSLAVLTVSFSYVKVNDFTLILAILPTILATAVIVELVKTFALVVFARKLGVWTEHRLWYFGLAMFLVTTFAFGIPFSSPSRSLYFAPKLTKTREGIVSATAILTTLAFAALFFVLLISGITLIGSTGLAMCIIMAFLDTFPVAPMNGKAIYQHSKVVWAVLFVVTLTLYASWLILL